MLLLLGRLCAQNVDLGNKALGFNVSANLAFGTHFQRLGFNLNFFYINSHFQANTELRAYFSFKNLGPKKMYPELVMSQGLVYSYGAAIGYFNPFFSSVSNQTGYSNAVAYSYNVYLNTVRTSQQTGLLCLQFEPVALVIENDLLARPSLDRFRTGAVLVQYQYRDQFQAGINCTLWTGKMGNRMQSGSSAIRSGCYMDTTGGVYPELSHGLLSAQVNYYAGHGQTAQLNAGIDAEQVRNAVQNRFMHDMVFLPKAWRTKNCYIPMIDDKGHQFLYREGQSVRKPRLYLNAFTNAGVFY